MPGRTGRPAARIAAAAEERIAFAAPARRLRLALAERALVRELEDRPLNVLDAGCGDGLLTLALARSHPRWSLVGVDVRDDLLAGARSRAAARGLTNVRFVPADLTGPPAATGLDVALALECLSEIEDDRAVVAMLTASLDPGGLLIVQVPDESWTPVLPGSAPTWREQVRQGYTDRSLRALLESAGLEVERVEPTYRTIAALAQEVRDRAKNMPLAVRAALFPVFAAAPRLELAGAGWGRPKALFAVARRPLDPPTAGRPT
jgi:trans-aconitate methyltransferase